MSARLALIAVFSFALGFAVAVGTTCRQTVTTLDAPALSSSLDADVVVALKELRTAIERLPNAMQDYVRGESVTPTRQAVGGEGSDAARLASAIDRLEKLLAQAGGSPGMRVGRGATVSWKGPGYASLPDLIGVVQQRSGGEYEALYDELRKAHSLWTTEDALDRYGPPNRIGTSHGFELIYDQATFDLGNERCWIEFYTHEGWVTSLERMCKDIR